MMKILYFYGEGCSDCRRAEAWVHRLEAEGRIEAECVEVWNHPANEERKKAYSEWFTAAYGRDTIVPAFVDGERKRVLCDPRTFEELSAWIGEAADGAL